MPVKNKRIIVIITSVLVALVVAIAINNFRNQSETPTPIVVQSSTAPSDVPTPSADWQLELAKIEIKAPIILDVDTDNEKGYLQAIEKGVAQYKGTAYPGQNGNAVIFGHSSYYKNKPGDYKEVFKRLNEITKGDEVIVRHDRELLKYKVSVSKVIADDDFSVVANTPNQTLTVLTCWPPGSLAKRYVIQAERVDLTGKPWPTPATSKTSKSSV